MHITLFVIASFSLQTILRSNFITSINWWAQKGWVLEVLPLKMHDQKTSTQSSWISIKIIHYNSILANIDTKNHCNQIDKFLKTRMIFFLFSKRRYFNSSFIISSYIHIVQLSVIWRLIRNIKHTHAFTLIAFRQLQLPVVKLGLFCNKYFANFSLQYTLLCISGGTNYTLK